MSLLKRRIASLSKDETVSCLLADMANSRYGVPSIQREFSPYGSLLPFSEMPLCFLPFSVLPLDILHSSLLCVAFLRYASLCDASLRVASLRDAFCVMPLSVMPI